MTLLKHFCCTLCKPFLPTLPTPCNYEKTLLNCSDPHGGDSDYVLQDAMQGQQLGVAPYQGEGRLQKLQEIFHCLHTLPCQVNSIQSNSKHLHEIYPET